MICKWLHVWEKKLDDDEESWEILLINKIIKFMF